MHLYMYKYNKPFFMLATTVPILYQWLDLHEARTTNAPLYIYKMTNTTYILFQHPSTPCFILHLHLNVLAIWWETDWTYNWWRLPPAGVPPSKAPGIVTGRPKIKIKIAIIQSYHTQFILIVFCVCTSICIHSLPDQPRQLS